MSSKPQADPYVLAFLALLGVAVILVAARTSNHDLRDQLRIERGRREEAEALANRRESQLDGALAKIHEQTQENGEPAKPSE